MREFDDNLEAEAITAEEITVGQTDGDQEQHLLLAYHMHSRLMDVAALASSTGLFKWQVKRHLKPKVIARMSPTTKALYCEALELSLQELGELPAD